MKKLLIVLLLSPLSLFAAQVKTTKSTIKSVTVYQQGAQIHRKAYYKVSKGLTIISIENISREIDPKSIQVKGTGDIIILDSKYRLKYPEPVSPGTLTPTPKLDLELNILNDSLMRLNYQLTDLQQRLDVLNTQKSILNNNGAIKGVGKVNDSIPLLREALDYYYQKMNLIHSEALNIAIEKNTVLKHKNRINSRISVINTFKSNAQKPTNMTEGPVSSIEITISADTQTSGKLEVSYLVNSAGWAPLYDIRSNSAQNSIDLTYKAQVYQNTGIDWLQANLTLSTTNPYNNKTKPELSPFYIYYNQNRQYLESQKALKKSAENTDMNEEVSDIVPTMATGNAQMNALRESKDAFHYVQLNKQLVSVAYEVNLPYSILSNSEKHLVLVRQESLKSSYKHYTVPKIDAAAYLVAELNNLDDLNLIPGIANIFHDGTYIGETNINPSIMEDSLAVSLGKDQSIQIKRTLLKKDSKSKVIGDKTIRTYAYLIEVKNHKSSQVDLIIQDQVPVSQSSDIIIEIEEKSKGELNEVTGMIDWRLKLKPKETKMVKLIYTVSAARDKALNLAEN